MARSLTEGKSRNVLFAPPRSIVDFLEDDDDDENDSLFDKRQSGHNVVGKQTKCELECVHAERHPKVGKGKTIKAAAKVCKNKCVIPSNKRGGKPITAHTVSKPTKKISVRDFIEDSDSNSSEEQQNQRRAFYDYLMEQVQRNNNE